MFPWFTVARYVAAMAAGAAVLFYTYATPRIDGLKMSIAQAEAAAAKEHDAFVEGVLQVQKEHQDEMDKVAKQAADERAARLRASAALSDSDKRLHAALAAAEAHNSGGLPQAASATAGTDATAVALGEVVAGLDDFAGRCAEEADRLADQVRGLLAAPR